MLNQSINTHHIGHKSKGHSGVWQSFQRIIKASQINGRSREENLQSILHHVRKPDYLSNAPLIWSGERALPPITKLYSGLAYEYPTSVSSCLPKITVIGAGVAGLNTAFILKKHGLVATVYEASNLIGGRIRTISYPNEPNQAIELGGEFIDSSHRDMLELAHLFKLPLIDTQIESETSLATAYFFKGILYSEMQVINAFCDIAPRIAIDIAKLSKTVSFTQHSPVDVVFDNINLAQYLDNIGVQGWLRKFIEVAYVTEYGLAIENQSALNFLSLISTDISSGLNVYGESDERFKILEGNIKIVEGLYSKLFDSVHFEHRLIRLKQYNHGYCLTFDTEQGTLDVFSDIVVLAIPFTLLKKVDLCDTLPAIKMRAINELGYGRNAKLVVGTKSQIWRQQGYEGTSYTDFSYQTGWDSSRLRKAGNGVYTFYLGADSADNLKNNVNDELAYTFLKDIDHIFPGVLDQHTGFVSGTHWPTEPFAQASYSAYRVGQWTTLAGSQAHSVNNIYFAGEHCSRDFQGYMNGGAESGRLAADQILSRYHQKS